MSFTLNRITPQVGFPDVSSPNVLTPRPDAASPLLKIKVFGRLTLRISQGEALQQRSRTQKGQLQVLPVLPDRPDPHLALLMG